MNSSSFLQACKQGNLEMMEILFDEKRISDNLLWNGLTMACKFGQLKILKCLLSKKILRPQKYDDLFWTTCGFGHAEIVKCILLTASEIKKPVEWSWKGGFRRACMNGFVELAQLILDSSVKLNLRVITQEDFQISLVIACACDHLGIVKLIVKNSPGLDLTRGLCRACSNGSVQVVKFIMSLENKENKNKFVQNDQQYKQKSDNYKLKADKGFHKACKSRHLEIVKIMFEYTICNNLHKYYQWPSNDYDILCLLDLGIPIDKFKQIKGYGLLKKTTKNAKAIVLQTGVMISNLLELVLQCTGYCSCLFASTTIAKL